MVNIKHSIRPAKSKTDKKMEYGNVSEFEIVWENEEKSIKSMIEIIV